MMLVVGIVEPKPKASIDDDIFTHTNYASSSVVVSFVP